MAKKKSDDASLRPSGDMLTAHLLALLKGWSAYGYELTQRLEASGLGDLNKGTVYRALRQMEKLGLVASIWDSSDQGPARRMYRLTQLGSLFLNNWLAVLDAHREVLGRMLRVTPEPAEAHAEATSPPPGQHKRTSAS